MDDLISRQAAIDNLISYLQLDAEYAWGVRECLNSLPSAQPDIDLSGYSDRLWQSAYERGKAEARKTGKWIWMGEKGDSRFMCSVCKSKEDVPTCNGEPTIWWFCPNCGADMRKETEHGRNN